VNRHNRALDERQRLIRVVQRQNISCSAFFVASISAAGGGSPDVAEARDDVPQGGSPVWAVEQDGFPDELPAAVQALAARAAPQAVEQDGTRGAARERDGIRAARFRAGPQAGTRGAAGARFRVERRSVPRDGSPAPRAGPRNRVCSSALPRRLEPARIAPGSQRRAASRPERAER